MHEREFALPLTGLAEPRAMKLAAGSHSWTELPAVQAFQAPGRLAVDTRGNVYVTDNPTPGRRAHGQRLVVKLPATAP